MKRITLFLAAIILAAVVFTPRGYLEPVNAQSQRQDSISVRIDPSTDVQQGRTAIVRVLGVGISRVQATFLGQFIIFHPTIDGDWMGFIAADMETPQGFENLDVYVWVGDDPNHIRIQQPVGVVWGGFPNEPLTVPFSQDSLLDPEVNQRETDLLNRVYNRTTPERLFTTFVPPVGTPLISSFGGFRVYNNDRLRSRHTGIDYRGNTGDPIGAIAHGRVIFAQRLAIRGNHVIIDHGWGVVSAYSHLNEILVIPGQLVKQGETIGLIGTTGRTQGAHLHLEIAVNGHWVDPSQFLILSIPPADIPAD